MNENSNYIHAEFLNRYSILIDDIKYLKSRQWTITYYLLLLYAAIIGIYKLMDFDEVQDACLEKILLYILVLLIASLGTVYQCVFQSRISTYRMLLKGTLSQLSESFRYFELKAQKERFTKEEDYTSYWNGFWLFTFPFIMIFWIGAAFIFWYFFH